MLGPIFSIEMLTSARRARFYLVRVLYAAVLFFALFTTYTSTAQFGNSNSISQAANVAGNFFYSFATLQILAVLMIGPALAAGTIAVERERRTIEYLFATDLTNREIVIGKLVARLLHIGCLVLVGLPILSLAMLMGGIAPEQLAAVFMVTFSTMVFVAVLAVTISVWSEKVREAFTKVYLVLFALLVVPGAMFLPMASALGVGHIVEPLVSPLVAGNPFTALATVAFRGASGTQAQLGGYYWEPVWELVMTQGIASVLLGILATWAVRRVHLKSSGASPKKVRVQATLGRRLKMGNYPMIWKERVMARTNGRIGIVGRVATWLIALGVLIPTIYWFLTTPGTWGTAAIATTSNMVACAGLLLIAGRAAGAITSEKEKDTWITLLSTPLSASEIIGGKLIGGLYAVRGLAIVLAVMWTLQFLKAPQTIPSLPFTIGTLAIVGAFAATMGLNYSLRCKNSTRAIGATLATALFAAGGYLFFGIPLMIGVFAEQLILAPCVPFLVAYPSMIALEPAGSAQSQLAAAYIIGCIGYAAAGAAIYGWIIRRFDKRVGRIAE
jgi:ABC-type transport system involved in multi-copper enzyme maturation permease subunit